MVERHAAWARFAQPLLQGLGFGMVGGAATATHVAVVWLLIDFLAIPAIPASLVAFLTAFPVSFAGNYIWTFRRPGRPARAMARFFLISAAALGTNMSILASLLAAHLLTPLASAVIAAAIVPVVTFLTAGFWGFQPDRSAHRV